MNKRIFILIFQLFITQLFYAQKCNFEGYKLNSFETNKRLKELKIKKRFDYSKNGYILIEDGDNKFADTLGKITVINLPKNHKILQSPNRNKTVFVGKNMSKGLEHSQYELSIYDFNSNLIKQFDYNNIQYLFNFGNTSDQYVLENGDFLKVFSNNLSGIIDANGNFVLEPKYNHITYLYANVFLLEDTTTKSLFNIKSKTFTPFNYDDYSIRNSRLNRVTCPTKMIIIKNGKYGLYDVVNNKVLIEPKFKELELIVDSMDDYNFQDNYYYFKDNENQHGLIDNNGKILIPALYEKFVFFSPDYDIILKGNDKKKYFFDHKKNKVLDHLKYDEITKIEPFLILSDYSKNTTDIYDLESSKTLQTLNKKFENHTYFNEFTSLVTFEDKSSKIVLKKQKMFIDIKTSIPVKAIKYSLNNTIFIVENTNSSFSLISVANKDLILENLKSYHDVFNQKNEIIKKYIGVKNSENSFSIVDELGNVIVKPFYSEAKYISFENEHFLFYSDKNKTSLINVFDSNGNLVSPFTYKVNLLKKTK